MSRRIPMATHSGSLPLAGTDFDCYVLDDGLRVLSRRKMIHAIGLSTGGGGWDKSSEDRLTRFLGGKAISPFVSKELAVMMAEPIIFQPTQAGKLKLTARGKPAIGYPAEMLVEVCKAVLSARKAKALLPRQMHLADACEFLQNALAKVGIIALVDEATGYQEIRDRLALQEILDRYLLKEYAQWAKRFPDEFYKEIFRLHGWQWKGMRVNRPGVVGTYTKDLVYERLAPDILRELEKRNPPVDGRRVVRHHQFFTDDIGHPALARHLFAVVALMRGSTSWEQFKNSLKRAFPKQNETIPLNIDTGGG